MDNTFASTLLEKERQRNADLEKQLKIQMRLGLQEGDKMVEMSRKIRTLETNLARMKSENYRLHLKLEEAKEAKMTSGQKPGKKIYANQGIFEDIKFGNKDEKENMEPSEAPVKKVNLEPKSNTDTDVPIKKKSVSMYDTVEQIEENGMMSENTLNTDENKEKLKKSGKTKKYNQVIDAEKESKEMQEQCAQQ